jgi:hypothetical protein
MNRKNRRASARHRLDRQSHRLPPQVCTLYVPEAGGYLADFTPNGFRLVEMAELARLYVDDEATSAALAFRELTGMRVAVRPFYCPHSTH